MRPSRFKDPRPLPGARSPPKALAPSAATAAPSSAALDRLDDALAKELAPQPPSLPSSASLPAHPLPTSPSASEVVARTQARTAARLDQLERLLRTQEAELRKRDADITRQQEELRALRKENREMHKFLADYGLQWVGPSRGNSNAGSVGGSAYPTPPGSARSGELLPGGGKPATGKQSPPPPPTAGSSSSSSKPAGGSGAKAKPAAQAPDMEAVRRAVSELNALANGEEQIVRKKDGSHGFVTPSLTLTFWKEGLQLDDGNLRKYDEGEATSFLRDMLDGYFPYELKHAFPEGVIFAVADNTSRCFGTPAEYDWGSGRKLDSRGATPRGGASNDHPAAAFASRGRREEPAGGHVLGGPGGRSGGGSVSSLTTGERMWNNPGSGQTELGAAAADERVAAAGSSSPFGAGALLCGGSADGAAGGAGGATSRIQIKGTDGQMACVLELPVLATLASVHAALLDKAVVQANSKYELRTAFPSRLLTEVNSSLDELGLAPSATLCVRVVSSK